jgi:YbgC/YbaW family acyl-CoA thioester hydrolase
MKELKKILESKMKIRFHDCDPFNHLNSSRYIDYFLTARGDQLIDEYDFNIYNLAQTSGIGWVSAQTQISYLIPAHLMEEVTIETQLIGYSAKSLLLEAFMWNADKTDLKALLWTKLVHINLQTQSSHAHSPALMEFFQQIINPLCQETSFEQRAKNLKHKL